MMITLNDIKAVYFIGIGGIGMSALARFFNENGVRVSGYDKTQTALTIQLEQEGLSIDFVDDVTHLPKDVQLVVYTPAIPKDHKGYQYYLSNGFRVVKRSDVLQIITQDTFNVCVSGTHGKTTISSMVGHLLRHSGFGCNAFLGGISVNYNRNFWAQEQSATHQDQVCVVEADEYDRSFHKLSPDIAVLSSMDPDHLDIYGTPEAMEDAFIEFTGKIKSGGWLIHKYGLSRSDELKGTHRFTYSLSNASSNFYTENLRVENGTYFFDVQFQSGTENWKLSDVHLQVGGLHNVENAVAAIAVARILKIEDDKIKAALKDFKGVKRRFEYVINPAPDAITLIDDYAHHPAELQALISGARSLFGKQKLILAFQPHLFSRTKDLADAFAESLDAADEVLLLPIYPARELPMEGVTSELIFNKMNLKQKQLVTRETLLHYAATLQQTESRPFVFITAGAGDIDSLLSQLKEKLTGA